MTDEENKERITRNQRSILGIWGREAELAAEMVCNVTPFRRLPDDQKWYIFKHFWMQFMRLHRAYQTFQRFGDNVNDGRVIILGNQTMNFYTYLYDMLNFKQMQPQEIYNLFGGSHEFQHKAVFTPVKKLRLTEMEFIVLVSQMLWDTTGLPGITPETDHLAGSLRTETYTALHEFYLHDMRIVNYAPRLAELHILITAIEKSVIQKKEDIMLVEIFDLAKVDRSVVDIF